MVKDGSLARSRATGKERFPHQRDPLYQNRENNPAGGAHFVITANKDGDTYVLCYRRNDSRQEGTQGTLSKKRKSSFFQPGFLTPDGGSASIPNVESFPRHQRQRDMGFCKAMAEEANAFLRDRACVYMDPLVDVSTHVLSEAGLFSVPCMTDDTFTFILHSTQYVDSANNVLVDLWFGIALHGMPDIQDTYRESQLEDHMQH